MKFPAPTLCEVFAEPLVIDINSLDPGLGHSLDAVGAGRVCDKDFSIFGARGLEHAGDFRVDGPAGVTDIRVVLQNFADRIGPDIGGGGGDSFGVKAGCDLVDGVRACLDDVHGPLHHLKHISVHCVSELSKEIEWFFCILLFYNRKGNASEQRKLMNKVVFS